MNDLSITLNRSKIGRTINSNIINHFFYAGDTVLIATSPVVLKKLLNICSYYADKHELEFNVKKTKCMIVTPKCFSDFNFLNFHINGKIIERTKTKKYLG